MAAAQVAAQDATILGPSDPGEVRSFFDDLISSQMEEFHIAGAVVAVVRDGETLLLAGYGHADLDNDVRVDPERTLFRIASITKTFTATAVMQLVEQGVLDLDRDVNEYLDFQIPAEFSQPITLRHLLTHTPGFEDLFYELLVVDEGGMQPFREWMVTHVPDRIWPPGTVSAYSNYGFSLAGYIVERVSGQPYAEYMREHVIEPLGMDSTTFVLTKSAEFLSAETKGYTYVDGRLTPTPFYLGQPAELPAGGLLSTASDMTRYMNMHLARGTYVTADGATARILGEETAGDMQRTHHAADSRLLGTALGLFDFTDNGQRTLGHSGEAYPISSLMLLMPDIGVGIFVAYNSDGAAELANQHLGFQRAVFDHYFPHEGAGRSTTDLSGGAGDLEVDTERFLGPYRMTRGSYTTFEKVGVLFQTINLASLGGNTLTMATPWGSFDFEAVDALYFRQPDGPFAISFREDAEGRIRYMATDLTPMFSFERLRWFETPTFNLTLLAVCVLLLLSLLAAGVVRLVRARRSTTQARAGDGVGASLQTGTALTRRALVLEWVQLATAAFALLFVVGVVIWGNPTPLFGVSMGFNIVLGIGVVVALLTVIALVGAAFVWREGYWRFPRRLHYSVGALAAVGFVWFLDNWNLLGWRY